MIINFLFFSLTFVSFRVVSSTPKVYKIGALVTSDELRSSFQERLQFANNNMNFSNTSIQFEALTISMNKKPIQASLDVCDNILNKNVHAVFVINDANFTNGPAIAVSYTCGFFQIPVIGIGIRNSVFSNKVRITVTFLKILFFYANKNFVQCTPSFRPYNPHS